MTYGKQLMKLLNRQERDFIHLESKDRLYVTKYDMQKETIMMNQQQTQKQKVWMI